MSLQSRSNERANCRAVSAALWYVIRGMNSDGSVEKFMIGRLRSTILKFDRSIPDLSLDGDMEGRALGIQRTADIDVQGIAMKTYKALPVSSERDASAQARTEYGSPVPRARHLITSCRVSR